MFVLERVVGRKLSVMDLQVIVFYLPNEITYGQMLAPLHQWEQNAITSQLRNEIYVGKA